MIAKSPFYYPALDGLRFYAFLLVFIHHLVIPDTFVITGIASVGWIGVDIFFCLSAFLLTQLIRRELAEAGHFSISNFFIRRILRIWPLYFTFVIIAILFIYNYDSSLPYFSWRAFGLLAFLENFFTAGFGYNPILFTNHLWTISYEEQFYIFVAFVIPVLASFDQPKRNFIFGAIVLVGWIIRMVLIYQRVKHPAIYVLPFTHFEALIIGMLLGFADVKSIKPAYAGTVGVLSLITIIILPGSGIVGYNLMLLYPAVGIFSGCLLVLALHSTLLSKWNLFTAKPLVFLGKISFGLYVFHSFTIFLAGYIFYSLTAYAQSIIAFALTIALSVGSYYVLERPFLKLKKKFTVILSKPV